MSTRKITPHQKEKWALIRGQKSAYGEKYAISNYGRLAKFTDNIKKGSLLKGSLQEGYPIWRYKSNGAYGHALLHKLVAKYFLPKPSSSQKIIIHLNYKKTDNHYKNLKWVSMADAISHQQKSPAVIKAKQLMRKNIANGGYNTKLTETNVKDIKRSLEKGKTLKELATKFKVSDMQIYRIKTGENWGYVK
jgi:NUMOD4 motif